MISFSHLNHFGITLEKFSGLTTACIHNGVTDVRAFRIYQTCPISTADGIDFSIPTASNNAETETALRRSLSSPTVPISSPLARFAEKCLCAKLTYQKESQPTWCLIYSPASCNLVWKGDGKFTYCRRAIADHNTDKTTETEHTLYITPMASPALSLFSLTDTNRRRSVAEGALDISNKYSAVREPRTTPAPCNCPPWEKLCVIYSHEK